MKSYKILNICIMVIAVTFAINFTSCSEDDVETNAVILEAYGPSPALRGGELTFIGKNLDKVTKVILPDGIEITDGIEIVSKEKIKVTIPQDTKIGYVKLIYDGDKELVTKTKLTFTEPIKLTKMSPSPIKAGQTLTLEGDYLNLIQRIIFSKDVSVDCKNFTKWERYKIELVLPAEAQTGIIILADTAEIPIELKSETELQVVLPSVTNTANLNNKKPGDLIEIEGQNLDLVVDVQLPSGASVPFAVNNNKISFTLPEGVTDGAVVMIPASGVKVAIANLGIAVPSELQVIPNTGLRGNDVITIKGVNMDLVTSVLFTGVDAAVQPTSKSATEIKVTMPELAKSGDVTLNTASGKTVVVTIETEKPELLSYNPNPVSAGTDLTITGHNLDLIKSLTFAGDTKVNVTATDASTLVVTVPTSAETGTITATMINGETVVFSSLTVDKPVCAYIPVMPDGEIKGGKLFIVTIANEDKLTGVKLNGQTINYVLDGTQLYIGIPSNAYGVCTLKLVSSNGEIDYVINVIPGGNIETVIWEGPLEITWNDGGRVMIPIDKFAGVTAGTYLKLYFQQKDAWGQAQINNGNWSVIPFAELGNDGYIKTDTYGDKSVTSQELKLTQSVLDNIRNNASYGNAIIIQGQEWIFSKATLVTKAKISEVIYTGPTDAGNWSGYAQISADKFANVAVGNIIHVKTSNVASDAQGSFKDGVTWTQIAEGTEYFTITGDFELEVTASIQSKLKSSGLVVGGKNYIIESVSIIKEM
ncbi:conserved exported hypothetical protein [uncultured Paludibacter sp.]|nr:conserved exported hypothetical protein [uncultured Paludibacter sp.]